MKADERVLYSLHILEGNKKIKRKTLDVNFFFTIFIVRSNNLR